MLCVLSHTFSYVPCSHCPVCILVWLLLLVSGELYSYEYFKGSDPKPSPHGRWKGASGFSIQTIPHEQLIMTYFSVLIYFFVRKQPSLASSEVWYFLGRPPGMKSVETRDVWCNESCGSNTKVKSLKLPSGIRDKNSKLKYFQSKISYVRELYL